jgi:hypothetical protein
VWQALHVELEPRGLTVVTAALDTDVEAARPFRDAAHPTHPSLVDPSHRLVELFGITNVPFALWVDEGGTIVRPPEVAFVPHPAPEPGGLSPEEAQARMLEQIPPARRAVVEAMMRSTNSSDRSRYVNAVRDWVANGAASPYVLSPQEVIARSRPRPPEAAMAAAEFELGQYLHRAGDKLDAVAHFQAAQRLDPENWSYSRQAFALVDPSMGDPYGTDLLGEVERVGVETFYPQLTI